MMSIQSPGFLPGNDSITLIPNNRKQTAENSPGVLSKNNPIFPPLNNPAKSCLVKTCRMGWVALSREWGNETIHSYDGDSFPHSLLRASQLSIFELKIAVLCFLSASSSQTSEAESQADHQNRGSYHLPSSFLCHQASSQCPACKSWSGTIKNSSRRTLKLRGWTWFIFRKD